jgi:hypothetical protein
MIHSGLRWLFLLGLLLERGGRIENAGNDDSFYCTCTQYSYVLALLRVGIVAVSTANMMLHSELLFSVCGVLFALFTWWQLYVCFSRNENSYPRGSLLKVKIPINTK